MFYGIVMLMVCVPMYLRYRSTSPILLLAIIFGGASEIWSLLIPEAAVNVSWIIVLLGLAGLLYKVLR